MSPEDVFKHPFVDVLLPAFEECLRDTDGRPLGEGNAPEGAKSSTRFSYRFCPYPGSRRAGLMNCSALAPMVEAWDEILSLLSVLRSVFLDRYPVAMNYLLLSRMAAFVAMFSGWLVRTGQVKWNAVPRPVSGLFKAAQGLYFTANDTIMHGGPRSAFALVTVEDFLERTEVRGIFRIGEHVCAGPPELVHQFARCAIEGGGGARGSALRVSAEALGGAIDYAALRLRAQQAAQVYELIWAAELATLRREAVPDRMPLLQELDRQCGLGATIAALTVPPRMEAELETLLRPATPEQRACALQFVRQFAALSMHYAGFVVPLQKRIDAVLGRDPAAHFRYEDYFGVLVTFGRHNLLAQTDELFDTSMLARAMSQHPVGMSAGAAADPETSLHQ